MLVSSLKLQCLKSIAGFSYIKSAVSNLLLFHRAASITNGKNSLQWRQQFVCCFSSTYKESFPSIAHLERETRGRKQLILSRKIWWLKETNVQEEPDEVWSLFPSKLDFKMMMTALRDSRVISLFYFFQRATSEYRDLKASNSDLVFEKFTDRNDDSVLFYYCTRFN